MRSRERGAALLLVLWATALLAILLVGVAANARSHAEAASFTAAHARAELAAEAGLAHAVVGLRATDDRWVPDGRPYRFTFDGAQVSVRVVDISGTLDLNTTSASLLRQLFAVAGADASHAFALAQAVVAWRSTTASAPTTESQGPFRTLETLAQVPGMDASLYARLAPVVTVLSGRTAPDEAYAGRLVLAAMRGIDTSAAANLVAARHRRQPARADLDGLAQPRASGADMLTPGYGGATVRVFSRATVPGGALVNLDATIHLALPTATGRPYAILGWRTDSEPSP